ncbi:MAG: hypothetical protein R8K53_00485 [Mariprofundaceae bacterium]
MRRLFYRTLMLVSPCFMVSLALAEEVGQSFDLGIESMRSHGYSVAIFIFMMISIAVFVGIVAAFFLSTKKDEKIKRGEMALFAMIILGVIAASVFAAVQLLDGVLF